MTHTSDETTRVCRITSTYSMYASRPSKPVASAKMMKASSPKAFLAWARAHTAGVVSAYRYMYHVYTNTQMLIYMYAIP